MIVRTPAAGGTVNQPSDHQAASAPAESAEAYDALVSKLERVVADLEGGKLNLEQSIERFAEGIRLAREASRKLDDAERRIEVLVRTADGSQEAVPFQPEQIKGT
jgi:exodeoxyribonuclease VII small subunit